MDRFQRRAVIEVSKAPQSSIPITVGVIALVVGMMIGPFGFGLLSLAGLMAVVAGIGFAVRKLLKGFAKLTNSAYETFFESQQTKQLRALHDLDRRLQRDDDSRTHSLLRQLWHLYQTLERDIHSGKLNYGAHDVLAKVDDMFRVCVDHLEMSYQLWEMARRQEGVIARQKLQQREELIQEVHASVDHLEQVISQLEESAMERNTGELKRLREELDESMRVAKAVEERTAELEQRSKSFETAE
jgi:hypothetical protein